MRFSALDRQKSIYINGISGQKPTVPVNMQLLKQAAQKKMSKQAYAYIAGGAGTENTISENRLAFNRWRMVPRMLCDVSARDTSINLFGEKLPAPLLLSPIGVLEMAHAQADIAVAKAAASVGVPMIFSNQASKPMEACAEVMGNSPRWFQLYWSKSDELVVSLVKRAEACGCKAIVVTLDTTLLGWRIQDLDLAYLPFLQGKGIAQYTSDPVFQRLLDEPKGEDEMDEGKRKINLTAIRSLIAMTRAYPGPFWQNLRSGRPLKAVKKFINIYSRPSLTWDNLAFLRKQTKLPILLKGILHPDDAQKALDYGMSGIIVSNHGGRQVDGAIGTLDALPAIADKIQGQIPILLDSGVRSGADVFKALALGATAVCIGRPYCYGLAVAGEQGVREVLLNFMADFDLTMGLAGCTNVGDITKERLVCNP